MGPTLIGLLQESVVKYSSLAALKSRGTDGNYQILTYAELYAAVSELGTGLISVGLAAGMHIALVAENGPRWLIADLAILGIGGVDVPVSTGVADPELEQVISHGDCEMAVVDSAGTLSRLLAMRKRIPRVRKVLVLDFTGPKPSAGTGDERVLVYTWEEMLQKGRTRIARGQRTFDLRAASVTPADTGHPPVHLRDHGSAQGRDAVPRQLHAQRHHHPRQHQPAARLRLAFRPARCGTPSSARWSTAASTSGARSRIPRRRNGGCWRTSEP